MIKIAINFTSVIHLISTFFSLFSDGYLRLHLPLCVVQVKSTLNQEDYKEFSGLVKQYQAMKEYEVIKPALLKLFANKEKLPLLLGRCSAFFN